MAFHFHYILEIMQPQPHTVRHHTIVLMAQWSHGLLFNIANPRPQSDIKPFCHMYAYRYLLLLSGLELYTLGTQVFLFSIIRHKILTCIFIYQHVSPHGILQCHHVDPSIRVVILAICLSELPAIIQSFISCCVYNQFYSLHVYCALYWYIRCY